jgi:hypothetical protein
VIAALVVCSRIADFWTTYQVTPTLKLETNVLVSRFGWRFAILTLLAGMVPYLSPPLGVMILTTSFIVAAFNASKIVTAKAIGEDELAALARKVMLATPPWPGLLFMVMPGVFIGVLGGCLLFFYPEGTQWGFYFGLGLIAYALSIFVWYPVHYFRVRSKARNTSNY